MRKQFFFFTLSFVQLAIGKTSIVWVYLPVRARLLRLLVTTMCVCVCVSTPREIHGGANHCKLADCNHAISTAVVKYSSSSSYPLCPGLLSYLFAILHTSRPTFASFTLLQYNMYIYCWCCGLHLHTHSRNYPHWFISSCQLIWCVYF